MGVEQSVITKMQPFLTAFRIELCQLLCYCQRDRATDAQKEHGMGGHHFVSGWDKEDERNMRRKDNARRKYGI